MTEKKKPDAPNADMPDNVADTDLDVTVGGALLSTPTSELAKRGFNPQPTPPALDPVRFRTRR